MKKIFILSLMILIFFTKNTEAKGYVKDVADILTDREEAELNKLCKEISEKHKIGIYILVLNNFSGYADSLEEASEHYYIENFLGFGEGKDGIMLSLSMWERDFWISGFGKYANKMLTDYGREKVLSNSFKENFSEDNWAEGFKDYIDCADYIFSYGEENDPMDVKNYPEREENRKSVSIIGGIIAGLIFAMTRGAKLKSQMNTAISKQRAGRYTAGGLNLTDQRDSFSHRTSTRVKITSDDSRGSGGFSGGGGTTVDSGGFSGSGGKF